MLLSARSRAGGGLWPVEFFALPYSTIRVVIAIAHTPTQKNAGESAALKMRKKEPVSTDSTFTYGAMLLRQRTGFKTTGS